MKNTNWLAIVVAAIAGMGMGFLWYGALFQEGWMLGNGITLEGEQMFKNGSELTPSSSPMIINTIAMVIYALVLNFIINKTNMKTWSGGAIIGGCVGLIASIDLILNNMFAFNDSSLSTIDGSYILVLLIVMGAIIGGWRKKT